MIKLVAFLKLSMLHHLALICKFNFFCYIIYHMQPHRAYRLLQADALAVSLFHFSPPHPLQTIQKTPKKILSFYTTTIQNRLRFLYLGFQFLSSGVFPKSITILCVYNIESFEFFYIVVSVFVPSEFSVFGVLYHGTVLVFYNWSFSFGRPEFPVFGIVLQNRLSFL